MKIYPAPHILIVLQYQANSTRSTPCRFIKKLHLDWHRGAGRSWAWLIVLPSWSRAPNWPGTFYPPLPPLCALGKAPKGWVGSARGETRVCLCWHRCRLLLILIGQRTGNFSKWILHYVHKGKYKKEREKEEEGERGEAVKMKTKLWSEFFLSHFHLFCSPWWLSVCRTHRNCCHMSTLSARYTAYRVGTALIDCFVANRSVCW